METLIQDIEQLADQLSTQLVDQPPLLFYISLDDEMYIDTPIISYENAISMGYYASAITNFYYPEKSNSKDTLFYIQVHYLKITQQELKKCILAQLVRARIENSIFPTSPIVLKGTDLLRQVVTYLGAKLQTTPIATYKVDSGELDLQQYANLNQ